MFRFRDFFRWVPRKRAGFLCRTRRSHSPYVSSVRLNSGRYQIARQCCIRVGCLSSKCIYRGRRQRGSRPSISRIASGLQMQRNIPIAVRIYAEADWWPSIVVTRARRLIAADECNDIYYYMYPLSALVVFRDRWSLVEVRLYYYYYFFFVPPDH